MSWLYCHNLQCMDCPRKIGCPHARFWSIFYCYLPLRVTAPRHHFLWDRRGRGGGGTKHKMGLDLNCVLSGDRWRGHGGPKIWQGHCCILYPLLLGCQLSSTSDPGCFFSISLPCVYSDNSQMGTNSVDLWAFFSDKIQVDFSSDKL